MRAACSQTPLPSSAWPLTGAENPERALTGSLVRWVQQSLAAELLGSSTNKNFPVAIALQSWDAEVLQLRLRHKTQRPAHCRPLVWRARHSTGCLRENCSC